MSGEYEESRLCEGCTVFKVSDEKDFAHVEVNPESAVKDGEVPCNLVVTRAVEKAGVNVEISDDGVEEEELGRRTDAEEEDDEDDLKDDAEEEEGVVDGMVETKQWEVTMPAKHLRVLLVEDDDSTRHVVAALLRNCSYEVTAVSNGLQALELLLESHQTFDLVLTDVIMPGMSGIQLLTKITARSQFKRMPVIMMSAHDSIDLVFRCFQRGAADFLVKPVRKNELKNLWQHVWRRCNSSSGSGSGSMRGAQRLSMPLTGSGSDSGGGDSGDQQVPDRNGQERNGNGSDKGSGTRNDAPAHAHAAHGHAHTHEFDLADGPLKKGGGEGNTDNDDARTGTSPPNVLDTDLGIGMPAVREDVGAKIGQGQLQRQALKAAEEEREEQAALGTDEGQSPSRQVADLLGNLGTNRKQEEEEAAKLVPAGGSGSPEVVGPSCQTGLANAGSGQVAGTLPGGEAGQKSGVPCRLPVLELTLKRPRSPVADEERDQRSVLLRSGASAFSRYSTGATTASSQQPHLHQNLGSDPSCVQNAGNGVGPIAAAGPVPSFPGMRFRALPHPSTLGSGVGPSNLGGVSLAAPRGISGEQSVPPVVAGNSGMQQDIMSAGASGAKVLLPPPAPRGLRGDSEGLGSSPAGQAVPKRVQFSQQGYIDSPYGPVPANMGFYGGPPGPPSWPKLEQERDGVQPGTAGPAPSAAAAHEFAEHQHTQPPLHHHHHHHYHHTHHHNRGGVAGQANRPELPSGSSHLGSDRPFMFESAQRDNKNNTKDNSGGSGGTGDGGGSNGNGNSSSGGSGVGSAGGSNQGSNTGANGNGGSNGNGSGTDNGIGTSNGNGHSGTADGTTGNGNSAAAVISPPTSAGPGPAAGSDAFAGSAGEDRTARREAALNKFRQKRKDRCFEKKVRYQSRKRLAEQRPRIRGQFVRQSTFS